jgi:hypothetical protein
MDLELTKSAIPKDFPVGRLRLTRMLGARKATGATRVLPPLMARAGGPQPKWRTGQTQDSSRRSIQAKLDGGTLAQWAAAKHAPESAPRTNTSPMMTESTPAFGETSVEQGSGTTRDANVTKAAAVKPSFAGVIHQRARALLRGPKIPKPPKVSVPKGAKVASDPFTAAGLGAIGAAAGFGTSVLLQKGVNAVRSMIWKNMTAKEKAYYLLRKVKGMAGLA